MDVKRLNKLADCYQRRADKAYMSFQDSGEQRYYSDYSRWSEICEIIRVARDAAEDHNELRSLKASLMSITAGSDAEQFMNASDLYERYRKMVTEVRSLL